MPRSARRTTSSGRGSPTARRRSAWRSPMRRRRAAAGRAGSGPRRRAPVCCCRSGSVRTGCRPPEVWQVWRAGRLACDGRGGRGRGRAAGRHDPPQVAERPRHRGPGRIRASASSPGSSARPKGSARAIRASWSASASTSTGRRPISHPSWRRAMTSLSEASGRTGRPWGVAGAVPAIASRRAIRALRAGRFDGLGWTVRQATTGRAIRLETQDGPEDLDAIGVDVVTGALIVADPRRGRRRASGRRRRGSPRARRGSAVGRGVTRWPDRH